MKYGIRAEGQFFICPLCPLFKSFATAGLDPLIHLHKMHRDICTVILWALVHGAMSGRWFPTLWRHNSSPTKI